MKEQKERGMCGGFGEVQFIVHTMLNVQWDNLWVFHLSSCTTLHHPAFPIHLCDSLPLFPLFPPFLSSLPSSPPSPPSPLSSLILLAPSSLLPFLTDHIQRTLDPSHVDSLHSTPPKAASAGANATSMEDHDDIVTSYKELIRDQVRT